MKEKRVDILLVEAGFYQLALLASAGTFWSEITDGEPRSIVMWGSLVSVVVSLVATRFFISKATSITRKTKKKTHDKI